METIEELDRWLAERNLNGHWRGMVDRDRGEFKPYLWKWADVHQGLQEACRLVAMDQTGRRTIQLRNPALGGRMSNTIHMSVQCVLPGEVAEAHRHTATAVRFVIQGSDQAFTIVDGEPLPMRTGDFITTPTWTWHDHINEGSEPVMWLDGLDVRLTAIGKMLGEPYPEPRQPVRRPVGYSAKTLGHAKPSWVKSEHPTPPFRYPWEETYATLAALKDSEAEGDPCDGIHLTYTHPLTGGPTLPTFACAVQLLTPHLKTKAHKHISTTIYQAFRGKGATVVDGERLEWSQGDIFIVPPWTVHHHENLSGEDAILYSMDDSPTLEALGLYREEEAAV